MARRRDPILGPRSALFAVALALVLLATLFVVLQRQAPSKAQHDAVDARSFNPQISQLAQSIGDEITNATLIARVQVQKIGAPFWNSPDGTDWSSEFASDPTSFRASPIPVTPVTVSIVRLFATGGPVDTDQGGPPKVELESQIQILFTGGSVGLSVGDDRIFFIRWTGLALSDGTEDAVWHSDTDQAMWFVSPDAVTAFPADQSQQSSLRTGAAKGDVTLVDDGTGAVLVGLDELQRVVSSELAEPGPNFANWPWEPAYRQAVAQANLPDGLQSSSPTP